MNTDPSWRHRALCNDLDPDEVEEKFFPHHNSDAEAAKKICRHCPVAAECLTFALETAQEFGVWGAMTEKERAQILAKRPGRHWKPPTPSDRCGTYSGSSRHAKRGEMQCDPCRVAKNEYEAASRKRRAVGVGA